ncbi:amidohydrolase [Serratia fonticola]|uniref:amidohydrolase n=1 Tax=Serratia fonticola TaxID=47917 RepID=UPI000FBE5E62|nr:amidohydrolase [Serratia fonticola]NTY89912.1 amidohydrolase [Serratia fonticola]NTZ15702.1 amidohydrolase [Serratia fonticola]CAI2018139.1 Indole-3-acetyl-aspartic acid hydrolase [Serratia fonticola]
MSTIDPRTLINWRRQFHAYPETGWTEFATTARVIQTLESMGHQVLTGTQVINPDFVRGYNLQAVKNSQTAAKAAGIDEDILQRIGDYTGCAAVFDTGRPGPVVALRFELDCVNVQESTCTSHTPQQENFASNQPGFMHACGHDGHMAIGLGVAQWLMDHRDQLHGCVKLLFQPAEEGVRGARPMAESGILDDVDFFACGHLGCDIPSNTIVAAPEKFLSTLKIDMSFQGKAAHAGMEPHLGKNALAAACHTTLQLLSLPTHGEGMTRVNVGVLHGGEGRNVIPSHAQMQVEVRGENEKINNFMYEEAMRRAQGAALSFDVQLETQIMGEAVNFVPDDEMTELIMAIARDIPSVEHVQRSMNFNGSDDATVLIKRVQSHGGKAAYFVIGSDLKAGHHQSEFDIDEDQLFTGYTVFTQLLERLLLAH